MAELSLQDQATQIRDPGIPVYYLLNGLDIGTEEQKTALHELARAYGVKNDPRPIEKFVAASEVNGDPEARGLYVHFKNDKGKPLYLGWLLAKPPAIPRSLPLLESVGLKNVPGGFPTTTYVKPANYMNMTEVPGVFLAGDVMTDNVTYNGAMASGANTAAGVSFYLLNWDNEIALQKYRASNGKAA